MNAIIDTGGGLRGAFGAGVLDRCLDENISFDYLLGISAGAANIASFLGGQKGRNLLFYTKYAVRPEYMGFSNILHNKCYLNLDYIYSTLSNSDGENPLDFEKLQSFGGTLLTLATDAQTGQPVYFTKDDYKQNDYSVLKASCCLPVVCSPVIINGKRYFDGGISNPIPIEKALLDNNEKVVLILTRPKDEEKEQSVDKSAAALLKKEFPALSNALQNRYLTYNSQLKKARESEKEGKVLIIAPDSLNGLKTLTKDSTKIEQLYKSGWEKGAKIKEFLDL